MASIYVGEVFNRLTVITFSKKSSDGSNVWKCRCECGNFTDVPAYKLRNGHTKSCGCFRNEVRKAKAHVHGHAARGCMSPTYKTWKSMIQRCFDVKAPSYENYGKKGITVCEKWMTFSGFLEDMGERPEGMSIDRIDPLGNYEASNCRWATSSEQASNKSNIKIITANGKSMSIPSWCKELEINASNVYRKIRDGMNPIVALGLEVSP